MPVGTRMRKFFSSFDRPWFWLLLLAVLSRIFVVGIGLYMYQGITAGTVSQVDDNAPVASSEDFAEQLGSAWVQWDGIWYNRIVNYGYDKDFPKVPPDAQQCNIGLGLCQRNFAFFPGYPLAVKGVESVTGGNSGVVGIVLSNIFFVAAAFIFFHLAKEIAGNKIAWTSFLVLLVFPAGYIFSGMMSESLFLLVLVSCYYLAYKKYWLAAGLVGILLSATRMVGILMLPSLVLLFWEQNRQADLSIQKLFQNISGKIIRHWQFFLALLLLPVGLLAFMLYLQGHTGDALAFIHIQDYFAKPGTSLNPVAGFFASLVNISVEGSLKNHLYNLAYFLLAAGLFAWNLVKRFLPLSLASLLLWLVIPMSAGTTLAIPRYLLPLFPVYILIGIIISKNKYLTWLYFLGSSFLLVYLTGLYVSGNFLTV